MKPTPAPPYEETTLPEGPDKIIRICEDLRERNRDGYVPYCGGLLAGIKGSLFRITKGTTCSPFTGTVIGIAFDEKYPRKDLPHPDGDGDLYLPMFNGGKDPLPFMDFYHLNNDGRGVDAVVKYNLGKEIDPTEMRRGDLLDINWMSKHGHSAFCWDVHLDAKGDVDCFQILASNGFSPGVSIYNCVDKRWLVGKNAVVKSKMIEKEDRKNPGKKKEEAIWSIEKEGTYEKAKTKIFVDHDDIVTTGHWLGIPKSPKSPRIPERPEVTSVDLDTFRVPPPQIFYSTPKNKASVMTVRCARFHYDEKLIPKPYCMRDGAAPAKPPDRLGHVDGPVTVVKGPNAKSTPKALQRIAPKPAAQDKKKPLNWQIYVENALRQFHRAKWIASDPGSSDDINDAKTQAAIKELQGKFKLEPHGIGSPRTRAVIERQLAACCQEVTTQMHLASLYRGKKLTHDPGPPNGVNHPETLAAVSEFQKLHHLEETGIPDADTLAAILDVVKGHEPTPDQPGLEPALHHLYWVGNTVAPGGSATLRLHFRDLIRGQACSIHLADEVSGREIEAQVKLVVMSDIAEVSVPIPRAFGAGANLRARVTAALYGEGELEATTSAPLQVRLKRTGPIAVIDGDDVYLDPPVRLWPQYDERWKRARIGGPKDSALLDWRDNGCNACTAAMTLRWFAEDCRAGKVPFPTKSKPGGSIDPSWYGLRMAESFWPNADPPGKVDLTPKGTIHFLKIYSAAAHYLKTGEIQRDKNGDAVDPSGPKARYATQKPTGGWLGLIREMLKTGPVIVGIGAPAGHFVLAHGIIGGALLVVDPGGVLWQAHNGGKPKIANWKGKDGYLDGTTDEEKVRMPPPSQWPGGRGPAPGQERDGRSYHLIAGQFLRDLLDNLISVTSLTYPEGAMFGGDAPAEAKPPSGDLEVFFEFHGNVGESNVARNHTYVGHKVPGKPDAYFLKGRLMIDVDGAPNCYHPDDLNVRTDYLNVDLLAHKGALDWKANGGKSKKWFGVVTDNGAESGEPIVQGPNDPCPGFYVSSTSLVDKTQHSNNPNRYVDARKIPYVAFPGQVYSAKGPRFTQVGEGLTGEFGDFITVVNPNADDSHKFCHAVFADMGGLDDAHFGEGSPALGQRIQAAGVVEAQLLYIIYPHSGSGRYRIPSLEEIQEKGDALFKAWGGMEEVARVLPLMK